MKIKKEKVTRDKKEKSILPGVIIVSLVVATVVYAVLLNAEKAALSDYAKGSVYIASKPIPKGQLITAANAGDYLTLKEIDQSLIPASAITDLAELADLISVYSIDQGSLLTEGMFDKVLDITQDMAEPVIAGCKADDLYQIVGGVLRAGDRINIYQVDEQAAKTEGSQEQSLYSSGDAPTENQEWQEDGGMEAGLVYGNVFVQQVFDQSGNIIDSSDTTTPAQRINIYLDNGGVADFYVALAKGSLRVVKICD